MHGKPYVTALRNAKRQMITGDFRKPYYWASFQLYSRKMGDNAAPLLQSKR
jgi:CHAT domain-containing protein